MPAVDVVQNWFVSPLFGVGQLCHANGTLNVAEPVQQFFLHLPQTVDGIGLQVYMPVKDNTFQCLDKLFYHQIIVYASIIACFNEICNISFGCPFYQIARTLEVGSHKACRVHDPLGGKLGLEVHFGRTPSRYPHFLSFCGGLGWLLLQFFG